MHRTALLFLALAALSACRVEPEGTAPPAEGTAAEGPAALPAEHAVQALPRSEVTVSAAGASTTGTGTVGSTASTRAVTSPNPRVQQALTRFNARRNDAGAIVLTLPENVLFDFDRADLRPDARAALDEIAAVLAEYAPAPAEVVGHTDSRGEDAYNQTLSERRAEAVRVYLAANGVEAGRLSAAGRGETAPVAPNERPDGADDPEGRQQNRRVEIVIQTPEGAQPATGTPGGQPSSTIRTTPDAGGN